MIRVKSIEIFEFRGIRNLIIDFKNQNFAICGRNGTGKSGVVDALEFALTGSISRLIGSGTGGISIKDHAPHVDSRNDPNKAIIKLTVTIPSLNKTVLIERSVKDPNNPKITPNTPEIAKILNEVSSHPEFTLSRRELIKYVISPPGDRAKEVQALLKLDKIDDFRAELQKVNNGFKKEVANLKREQENAHKQLQLALEITELNKNNILEAVNLRRDILGLGAVNELTSSTSVKDGLASEGPKIPQIPKKQALESILNLNLLISNISSPTASKKIELIKEKLMVLNSNSALLNGVTRFQFLKMALQLVDDELCPVCETPWDSNELKKNIQTKLNSFDEAVKKRAELEKEMEPIVKGLSSLNYQLKVIEDYGVLLNPPIEIKEIKEFRETLQNNIKSIQSFIPLNDTISCIESCTIIPSSVIGIINAIEIATNSMPDLSKQDAAREYLTIAQERLEVSRGYTFRLNQADGRYKLTNKIFDIYSRVSTSNLEGIYKEVEKDFSELYRFINQDDEASFTAQLTPSLGKLGFNVDFYGRGYFPPGAYHSEGHQDGMGLCLYLALMKHLSGKTFTFAVLDDVLMSVDSGHRREVCRLLKEKFPETQFILTTHDEVWLKHMKTAGLIQNTSSIFFKNWSVDLGPSEWSDRNVWKEIEDQINNNDIRAAASLLRHYLEYISTEICHRLRAKVEFRGDSQFQLGDLLPNATSQFTKLLTEGENVAISWGKTTEAAEIKKRRKDFGELVTQSQLEQWQTNPAIHYNEWINLDKKDFTPVAQTFQRLIESFICSEEDCKSFFYVIPERGTRQTMRCSCDTLNINLQKKT